MRCFSCVLKDLPEKREAVALPVLLLYAPPKRFPGAPPARSVCGLPVCDEHKAEVTIDYLLTDEGYAQLVSAFMMMGKAPPERAATRLEFIPIGSVEARTFLRASGRES